MEDKDLTKEMLNNSIYILEDRLQNVKDICSNHEIKLAKHKEEISVLEEAVLFWREKIKWVDKSLSNCFNNLQQLQEKKEVK